MLMQGLLMHPLCYGAAPTQGQRSLSNDQEGLGSNGEAERKGVATQAYPKIRARVLIRHKRLYLVCTGETRTLFKLSRASVCKRRGRAQDEAGKQISNRRTITCPRR